MNGDPKSSPGGPVVANVPDEPQLPVFRFGLKQLFVWFTAIGLLLAVLVAVPTGLSLIALVLAISVVTLHVLSTAIGTRLRDHANERRAWEASQTLPTLSPPPPSPTQQEIPTTIRRSPLHGHDQPLRRMRICLTAGAMIGGLTGVAALSVLLGNRTTIAGILVGAASTAVVGAWIAFVVASAWSIFCQGWRDALREGDDKPN